MLLETCNCHSSTPLTSSGQPLITYGCPKTRNWGKWVLSLFRLAWSIHCRYRLLLSSSCFSRLVTLTRIPLWPPRDNHSLLMAVKSRKTGTSRCTQTCKWSAQWEFASEVGKFFYIEWSAIKNFLVKSNSINFISNEISHQKYQSDENCRLFLSGIDRRILGIFV